LTTVYPFNLQILGLNITGYGIMMMVGFLVGGWLIDQELRRRGWHHEYAADITVAAVIGGILGAKLWYVAQTGEARTLFERGGLVWYGGFIGGAAAVLFNSALLKVSLRWTCELAAPALAAAYGLGRLGCFLVGDDYGRPTTLPWATAFPQGLPPTTAGVLEREYGIPMQAGVAPETLLGVHPTQLYEAFSMIAVFMILWQLRTHTKGTGWLFGLYLVFAGVERFLVEFVRAKTDHVLGPLTAAQLTALGVLALGIVLLTMWRERQDPGPYLAKGRKSP
jgi:phosphatidylglycerol:prolipoprotein diacylglycerol transferase